MSENTAAVSFISASIKDFNDWADTLAKRGNDEDTQGVIDQLDYISKSVNNDQDLNYPKSIEEGDGKKIAGSYDDHISTHWIPAMKALSSAADSLKSSDSSKKIPELLEKLENGFQGFTDKLVKLLDSESKKIVEEAAEKSSKAAKDVRIKF